MRLGQCRLFLAVIALPMAASPMHTGADLAVAESSRVIVSDSARSSNASGFNGLRDATESIEFWRDEIPPLMPTSYGLTYRVPEAGTIALVGLGLIAIGLGSWRRRRP